MGEIEETRVTGPAGTPAIVYTPRVAHRVPCVVLLHERYGLVQHTRDAARRVASFGYVVVAPDLFATHPDQAGLQAGTVQAKPADTEVLALLDDAVAVGALVERADVTRLGMIGVCQTGRYPFLWAAHRPLRACVALYGAAMPRDWVVSERQPWGMDGLIERMSASVLGIYGESDHIIAVDDVLRLRSALERHGLDYRITLYEGAPHGWLNDTMPGRYRPELAEQAWAEIALFLHARFGAADDARTVTWSFNAAKSADYDFTRNERLV